MMQKQKFRAAEKKKDKLGNGQIDQTSQKRCWRSFVKQMTSTRLGLAANQAWGLA